MRRATGSPRCSTTTRPWSCAAGREPLGAGSWIRFIPAVGDEEASYFDSHGRMTAMRRGSGASLQRWTFSYGSWPGPVEARYTDREATQLYTFRYDGADRLIEVLHSVVGGAPVVRRSCTYSPAGNLETETASWFDSEGKPDRAWVKSFDSAGRLLEKEYRHERWPFSCRWTYRYDAAGQLTMKAFYDSHGRIFSLTESSWDDRGNKLSERRSGRGVFPAFQALNEYDA